MRWWPLLPAVLAACSEARVARDRDELEDTGPEAAGSDAAASDAAVLDAALSPAPGLVYVAETAVGALVHVPIGPAGPGSARAIAPRRAGGFGLRSGSAHLAAVAPDGQRAVVVVDQAAHGGGRRLFALPADGSGVEAPVDLGRAEPRGEYAFSDDGAQLLFVDAATLKRVPLAGGAAVALATAPEGAEIRRSRWVEAAGRVVYELDRTGEQTTANVHSVRLDGADPLVLTAPGAGQDRVQAVLPDGRLLVLMGDAMYALPSAGGAPVRVSPTSTYTSLVAVLDGGRRALLDLSDFQVGRLVVVETDGSTADAPLVLTDPLEDLQAVADVENGRVAFVGARPGSAWVVFEGSVDGGPIRPVSGGLPARPWLAGYAAGGRALVGCAGGEWAEDVVRFDLPGSGDAAPVVLVEREPVQPGCPSPDLTPDASHAVFFTNEGGYAAVPVVGGPVAMLDTPLGAHCLPASGGLFCGNNEMRSALRVVASDGTIRDLLPEAPGALSAFEPLADGATLRLGYLHGSETVSLSVALDGHRPPRTVVGPGPDAGDTIGSLELGVAGTDSIRLQYEDRHVFTRVFAVPLADEAPARDLYRGAIAAAWLDLATNAVLVAADGHLFHVPASGGEPRALLTGANLTAPALDPQGAQVFVGLGDRVVAAALDGSEAAAPRTLAAGLAGQIDRIVPIPGARRAVVTTSTTDTAVPHPLQIYAVPTDAAGLAVALAPPGRSLPAAPVFSPDGAWVLVRGGETSGAVEAVRVDGQDAAQPLVVVEPADAGTLRIGPDGRRAVFQEAQRAVVFPLDPPGPGTSLTARALVFSPDGETIAWLEAQPGDGLFAASAAEPAAARALGAADTLSAITSDGDVLYGSDREGDTSLYAVPLNASGPARRLTPGDDADERYVTTVETR